jgi:hypothetical protein
MNRRTVVVVSLLAMLMPMTSQAFDHDRKGFLLGSTLGLGYQRLTIAGAQGDSSAFDAAALATGFRVGWGLNDKTEVYFFSSSGTTFVLFFVPVPITQSINGIAIRRYFDQVAPGFYVNAGTGFGSLGILVPGELGFGAMGAVGYEYRKHWSAELEGMWLSLEDSQIQDYPPHNGVVITARITGTLY